MTLSLRLLQLYTPSLVKRRALEDLFDLTAEALATARPATSRRSAGHLLHEYATFTAEQASRALARGVRVPSLYGRLRLNAFLLGSRLRERFRPAGRLEVMALARVLYRMLGIDFLGTPSGEIVVRRCYFSAYYTPRVCHFMSALDEGLLAGLAGGGTLTFSERITEGTAACRACFQLDDAHNGGRT